MSLANLTAVPKGPLTPAILTSFLRRTHADNAGPVDRLKISYRPHICPFGDLLDHIQPGAHVFDIGCGSGQFCLLASHFRQPGRLTGIEIGSELIANAMALFAHAAVTTPYEFHVFDGAALPRSLGQADIVFLIDVLHHVPPAKQHSFLQAIYSGMKPGAILILKDIEAASPLVVFNRLHDLLLSHEIGHELSSRNLSALVTRIGFQVRTLTHMTLWVYPHYTAVLVKPTQPACL
jgi:2-polyprenyl-3-methyl-5-hydroxy-6-metoxy-1,4-benzoquinol methylase